MSLQSGRAAIEAYIIANWTDTPMGLDGHAFEVTAPSIRMTITEGRVYQGSIGRVLNEVHQVGIVTFQIFTAGGMGSAEWRGYAQTLMDLFHNVTLDAAGAVVTSGAQTPLVRFSPPKDGGDDHPYIAADLDTVPFRQTNVICGFVRYELR